MTVQGPTVQLEVPGAPSGKKAVTDVTTSRISFPLLTRTNLIWMVEAKELNFVSWLSVMEPVQSGFTV